VTLARSVRSQGPVRAGCAQAARRRRRSSTRRWGSSATTHASSAVRWPLPSRGRSATSAEKGQVLPFACRHAFIPPGGRTQADRAATGMPWPR